MQLKAFLKLFQNNSEYIFSEIEKLYIELSSLFYFC
jgi:hypothetical protein